MNEGEERILLGRATSRSVKHTANQGYSLVEQKGAHLSWKR